MAGANLNSPTVLHSKQVPFSIEHTIKDYEAFYNDTDIQQVTSENIRIESTNFVFKLIIKKQFGFPVSYLSILLQCVSSTTSDLDMRNHKFWIINLKEDIGIWKTFSLLKTVLSPAGVNTMDISPQVVIPLRNPFTTGGRTTDPVYTGKLTFKFTGKLLVQEPSLETFLQDFEMIFNDEETSDVTFIVGETKFFAHRSFLIAHSPVFKAMFRSQTKESLENTVRITDIESAVLEEFLRFFYTNEVRNLAHLAPDLLVVADKYDVAILKDLCETGMLSSINIENCVGYFIQSYLGNARPVYDKTLQFIKAHLTVVANSDEWIELEKSPYAAVMLSDVVRCLAGP